jgi:membrane protein YqaA with SNARE-associated domain
MAGGSGVRGEGETTPEKPVREGSDSENPVPGDYISEDYVPEDHFHGPGKKIHRRLYDWVLHWADTPQGPQALGFLSWIESFIFPIPPDPLLMALCLGAPKKALRFAAITTVASVVGGLIGYGIGAYGWQALEGWFFQYVPGVDAESFAAVQGLFLRWDFWAVFAAGLTPLPYKVFTISSGVFGVTLGVFVVASALSRGLRFFAEAGLIYKFGAPIARAIDKYFDFLAFLFLLLLIGGFVLIEFVR